MSQHLVILILQILILKRAVMDLNLLVQELGDHSDEESIEVVEEFDVEEDENTASLQENYNSLLEKSGVYT